MLDHIFSFFLVTTICFFASAMIYGNRGVISAVLLGASVYAVSVARSNGVVIPLVVIIAFSLIFLTLNNRKKIRFVVMAGLATVSFSLCYLISSSYFNHKSLSDEAHSQVPRFLFCNLYGHAVEGLDGRRADISIPEASLILETLRLSQSKNPEIFSYFKSRYPFSFKNLRITQNYWLSHLSLTER